MAQVDLSPLSHQPHPISIDQTEPEDGKNMVLEELITTHDDILKSRLDGLSRWEAAKLFRRIWWYTACVYMLNTIDSWQISIAGSIIVNKGFIKQFGTTGESGVLGLDSRWVSAWGAIINVGQFCASWYVPLIASRYGRKPAFYLTWLSFVICLIFLTTAKSPAVWLIGKLWVGIAAGTAQYTTTPYMVEVCPNRIRGTISGFQGLWSGAMGITCAVMLQITNERAPDFYLLPVYVCWGVSGLMLVAVIIIPESPWAYARQGKKEKALKSMRRLYGNIPDFNYEEEYSIIEHTLNLENHALADQKATYWKDLFVGVNKWRTGTIVLYAFSIHWGGMPLVSTFGTYFFAIAGWNDPFLAGIVMSCIGLVTTIVYSLLIDKIGRRLMTIPMYGFMSASLWLIGGLYYVHTHGASLALLVLVAVWQIAYGFFTGPYGLMCSELPSAHLRVKTNAFLGIGAFPSALAVTVATPQILAKLNLRGCFVFGATCLPFLCALYFALPETRGRSAGEIDELYENKVPPRKWAKTRTVIEDQTEAVIEVDRATAAKLQVHDEAQVEIV